MFRVRQLGSSNVVDNAFIRCALAVAIALLCALPTAAQYPGPPARTTVNGHFLGPPPSVTSLAGRNLPPPLPSVTSIPNYPPPNYAYVRWYPNSPYYNGRYRNRGYGYGGYGYSYAPYYIPVDGYGYDYVGGPDVYSGPPIVQGDPLMHMVVEQPPARYPYAQPDVAQAPPDYAPPAPPQQPVVHDAKPNEPSVLVFRDGHQQEVSNYAIMGQNVYVFDKGSRKVALADLDVPATIKANDERGLDFNIPAQKPAKKKSDLELKVPADDKAKAPENIASVAP